METKTKKTGTETITISNVAANAAFNEVGMCVSGNEISGIPGFNNADTYGDPRQARSGRIPSIFMITRISDGKVFGAPFNEAADDNSYAESPFYPQAKGETAFREVQHKERIVTEEHYEFV